MATVRLTITPGTGTQESNGVEVQRSLGSGAFSVDSGYGTAGTSSHNLNGAADYTAITVDDTGASTGTVKYRARCVNAVGNSDYVETTVIVP